MNTFPRYWITEEAGIVYAVVLLRKTFCKNITKKICSLLIQDMHPIFVINQWLRCPIWQKRYPLRLSEAALGNYKFMTAELFYGSIQLSGLKSKSIPRYGDLFLGIICDEPVVIKIDNQRIELVDKISVDVEGIKKDMYYPRIGAFIPPVYQIMQFITDKKCSVVWLFYNNMNLACKKDSYNMDFGSWHFNEAGAFTTK